MKIIFEGTPDMIRKEAAALLAFTDGVVLADIPKPEPAAITPAALDTAPVPPVAPIPTAQVVPVAPAKTYTLDDLITAAAPLLDAGKFEEMTALTRKYGADSFMAIKESDFNAVAADLRAMGAKL